MNKYLYEQLRKIKMLQEKKPNLDISKYLIRQKKVRKK